MEDQVEKEEEERFSMESDLPHSILADDSDGELSFYVTVLKLSCDMPNFCLVLIICCVLIAFLAVLMQW